MDEHRYVVVACSHMEDRTCLIHILENLSLDVISCSDMNQVHEVLSLRNVPLLFCDEYLSEGCLRDLVSGDIIGRKAPHVVVTIRIGDWDKYLQVIRLGAYDGLRCPLCPTDVELVALRAMREDQIIKSDGGRNLKKADPAGGNALTRQTSSIATDSADRLRPPPMP